MKTNALCFALILLTTGTSVSAQVNNYGERHSGALNLGWVLADITDTMGIMEKSVIPCL